MLDSAGALHHQLGTDDEMDGLTTEKEMDYPFGNLTVCFGKSSLFNIGRFS